MKKRTNENIGPTEKESSFRLQVCWESQALSTICSFICCPVSDCKQNCCKYGPGPYKVLTPEEYFQNFCYAQAYNTRCIHLTNRNKCKIWGTKNLPSECRSHVCHNKKYSKEELELLKCMIDEDLTDYPCPTCGCKWYFFNEKKETFWCEICNTKWQYIIKVSNEGLSYLIKEKP